MKIRGFGLDAIGVLLDRGLACLDSGHVAGYVALLDVSCGGDVMATFKVNVCPANNARTLHETSLDFARQLNACPNSSLSIHTGIVPIRGFVGVSAIRAGSMIFSFAGMPFTNHDAEALLVYVAFMANWITEHNAFEIARVSENHKITKGLLAIRRAEPFLQISS